MQGSQALPETKGMKGAILSSLLSVLPRYEYLEGVKSTAWGVVAPSGIMGKTRRSAPLVVLHRINEGRWKVSSLPIVIQLGGVTAKVEVCALGCRGFDYFCSSTVADTTPFSVASAFRGVTQPREPDRLVIATDPLPHYRNEAVTVETPKIRTTLKAVAVRLPPIQIQES
jgi:hypothetical protein